MKIKDLIHKLQKYNPEDEIYFENYGDYYQSVCEEFFIMKGSVVGKYFYPKKKEPKMYNRHDTKKIICLRNSL